MSWAGRRGHRNEEREEDDKATKEKLKDVKQSVGYCLNHLS